MNASKEEARKAYNDLETAAKVVDDLSQFAIDDNDVTKVTELVQIIKCSFLRAQDFLVAAERKLPTEAAYAKDSKRRKKA